MAATDEEVDRAIPGLRRRLRRSYALSPDNVFADAARDQFHQAHQLHSTLHKAWHGVPMGGALEVAYPRHKKPKIHQRVDTTMAHATRQSS